MRKELTLLLTEYSLSVGVSGILVSVWTSNGSLSFILLPMNHCWKQVSGERLQAWLAKLVREHAVQGVSRSSQSLALILRRCYMTILVRFRSEAGITKRDAVRLHLARLGR